MTDCSGNGEPIIAPLCKAECNCAGGWEGKYCERISANGGGDPHLETLDGKSTYHCCILLKKSINRVLLLIHSETKREAGFFINCLQNVTEKYVIIQVVVNESFRFILAL